MPLIFQRYLSSLVSQYIFDIGLVSRILDGITNLRLQCWKIENHEPDVNIDDSNA